MAELVDARDLKSRAFWRVGSSPTRPTYRGVAQMARVSRLGREGRRFESSLPDKDC